MKKASTEAMVTLVAGTIMKGMATMIDSGTVERLLRISSKGNKAKDCRKSKTKASNQVTTTPN
jgi:hypothetical protein